MTCDRCGGVVSAHTMSFFNTDTICLDCMERERLHPDYRLAREAEADALRRGDRNFPGIGLPVDLQ